MQLLLSSVLILSSIPPLLGFVAIDHNNAALQQHHQQHHHASLALCMANDDNDNNKDHEKRVTLYGHPGTRSPLVNWACHELGVTVEMGDLRHNPHPFGQIPCLVDNNNNKNAMLFESGAILAYLIQHYSSDAVSTAERAAILSWIVWANASLDPICFLETPDGKVYDTGLKQPNKRMDRLEQLLLLQQQQQSSDKNALCLVPSVGFSVADVAVTSYLLYVLQFFPQVDLSTKWPTIVQYMKEAASRPTYAQAFGQDLQTYLVDKLSSSTPSQKLFGMF